jgi:hypothetical protein
MGHCKMIFNLPLPANAFIDLHVLPVAAHN